VRLWPGPRHAPSSLPGCIPGVGAGGHPVLAVNLHPRREAGPDHQGLGRRRLAWPGWWFIIRRWRLGVRTVRRDREGGCQILLLPRRGRTSPGDGVHGLPATPRGARAGGLLSQGARAGGLLPLPRGKEGTGADHRLPGPSERVPWGNRVRIRAPDCPRARLDMGSRWPDSLHQHGRQGALQGAEDTRALRSGRKFHDRGIDDWRPRVAPIQDSGHSLHRAMRGDRVFRGRRWISRSHHHVGHQHEQERIVVPGSRDGAAWVRESSTTCQPTSCPCSSSSHWSSSGS